MIVALYDPVTGKIDTVRKGPDWEPPAGNEISVDETVTPQTHYIAEEAGWLAALVRPACTIPNDGTAPMIIAPKEGETIRVKNEAGHVVETSDPNDPITITSAGFLRVTVTAPFPAQNWSGRVEVTDA